MEEILKKDEVVNCSAMEQFYIVQCMKYRTVIQQMIDDLCIIEYGCSYKGIKNKTIAESTEHAIKIGKDILSNNSIFYEPNK